MTRLKPVGEGEVSEKASVAEAVTAAVEAAKEVATAEAVKAATAAISAVTVIAEGGKSCSLRKFRDDGSQRKGRGKHCRSNCFSWLSGCHSPAISSSFG